ncbi:MAG: 2,3-bisphosphoglycerate-independent phosphoglycerate mutase [Planctomycetes bacterium]|jgi:2,3-bisphosphoglycerate-independent phosphoglycerate mutase|nr:2,3-bisphosphoglycerate-independent phosphoglycerate mutase [Planctomycetota bacterium]HNZ66292.1 2,3-bisphosphoglycerate-independent phosphoglycerate mutase [Planctomycetota bacterium]HPY75355.1 2,3-bisphosphoglycerate-independent phosphoglycerate mutase [Planctomycetota bacterium]HQA99688.1 2,3-bisphosphoglycerate-independent phosphoglycerate mutase [Planctomycetota bacterium]
MNYKLQPHPNFSGRKGPLVLIILDGVGIGKDYEGNAFTRAKTTNLNNWIQQTKEKNLYTQLQAHGTAVGLPTDDDMGNSEVGHNAIGSGQIYHQGAMLVNESIASGRIKESDTWKKLIVEPAKQNHTIHFLGLLSDGNVHSHIQQLFSLLDYTVQAGAKKIRVHTLLDGRDVAPDSGLIYIQQLEEKFDQIREQNSDVDIAIASGGGRMHVTMDRYNSDWNIVQRGWNAHVRGIVAPEDIHPDYTGYYTTATEAIQTARKVYPEKQDQFNPTFVIVDENKKPIGKMQDGDTVINFNFRGDRAIEISEAFVKKDFTGFDRVDFPNVQYAGMLEYDTEVHMPPMTLVRPPEIHHVTAQYLTATEIPSYAIAETHKYGHVTYFWNGNKSGYIDEKFEKYEEVASEPNEMIESHPEMRAQEVTDKLLQAIQSKKYKFLRVNYANGDMVGHTGNIQACIKAMETIDNLLPTIVEEVKKQEGIVIITADHGNVEEKIDKKGKPKTSHTLNPVPFFILDFQYNNEYKINSDIQNPGIANIASTFINLLGYQAPEIYQPSLILIQ